MAWILKYPLILGKMEDKRRRGQQSMRWFDGIANPGHEFEQTPEESKGQGSLACYSPDAHKELDKTATEQRQQWP